MQRQKNGSEDPPLQNLFPWREPVFWGGIIFHPVDGLGACEGIFSRVGAEVFAERIRPDVAGWSFCWLVGAKDVVVVTLLPEAGASEVGELVCSALFEDFYEFGQVAGVGTALA